MFIIVSINGKDLGEVVERLENLFFVVLFIDFVWYGVEDGILIK